MGSTTAADAEQLAFDLDEALLRDTTFVVVDLETTGGRAKGGPDGTGWDCITEIGAVKVRGGQVIGELATLVDPGRAIPPQIVQLTGITTAMVCDAPRIESVLPSFLEFCRGAVLVAHNAGFDVGFLRAAAERAQLDWPRPPVLCTVKLARRVLTRDEAPSVRLSELARLFRTTTTPTHRALDDARATVDVLHGLLERIGNQGVHTLADLRGFLPDVSPAQRRNRRLADALPNRPGVYLFRGPSDEVLYVGTAVDLRRRVRHYFTGADPRTRIKEMASLAVGVDHVECAHELEAGVRELRLLAAHAPPYNRRSKAPHRWWWVVLTDESFPRFSVVRSPKHDRAVGPFRARADAVDAAALLARFTGVRTCTTRLARTALHGPRCPEVELSGCPAPRGSTAAEYAHIALEAANHIAGIDNSALAAALHQIDTLAADGRYETAARLRDRTETTIDGLWRGQRLRTLTTLSELVAARPDGAGGWHLVVIRHGQLAAAGNACRGVPPMPIVDAICAAAQVILPSHSPLGGALVEETALIARWLSGPGVRIVRTDADSYTDSEAGYCTPVAAAGRLAQWAATARSARVAAEQLERSDLLGEPGPSREQLLGRPGIDGLGGTRQTPFPRRHPLGVAG
ncbi:DNA polymerase-3 subunit epsilon [Mycobacterium sp. OTB74]|nr:DNA polymerase-3 subunit epsilon [Mycobacterium sp. OTB74]